MAVVCLSLTFVGCTPTTPIASFSVSPSGDILVGQRVNLDASGSSGEWGTALSFAWTLSPPPGSRTALVTANAVAVSFTPDEAGEYSVTLTVKSSGLLGATTGTTAHDIEVNAPQSTLTVRAGTGGSVSPSGSVQVTTGGALQISATPDAADMFVDWTVTAGSATFAGATSANTTVTVTSAGAAIVANFEGAVTLSVEAGTGGTVSPSGSVQVAAGAATQITAIPTTGYSFVNWTVVSGNATIVKTGRTKTAVTISDGNATVQANFSLNTPEEFTGNFLSWTGSGDGYTSELVRVSGQDGGISAIGGNDYFPAMAYGSDGTLYGIADKLCVINPGDGSTQEIGDLTYQGSKILMRSASFSPSGTLYVLESDGDSQVRLFTVDLSSGSLTLKGTLAIQAEGMAFSDSGTLYVAFDNLSTLDPLTAAASTIAGSITPAALAQLSFGENGVLYGLGASSSQNIYTINVTTGAETSVLTVSSPNLSALVAERSPPSGTAVTVRSVRTSSPRAKEGTATLRAKEQVVRDASPCRRATPAASPVSRVRRSAVAACGTCGRARR